MIKLIIFDLDGVLVDAKEIHYEALNKALSNVDEKYVINREEHISTYDGNTSVTKLSLLSKNKGLPYNNNADVFGDLIIKIITMGHGIFKKRFSYFYKLFIIFNFMFWVI